MNKEQKTIKKIQELLPRFEKEASLLAYNAGLGAGEWEAFLDKIDITLNDIKKVFKQNNNFGSCNTVLNLCDLWNDEDNFEKQSQKCKDFIGKLLN